MQSDQPAVRSGALTREQMAQQIIDLVTGQETEPAFFAQADAMATGVGGTAHLSGYTLEEALEYLDGLHAGMREHIVKYWGDVENIPRI